MEYRDPAADPNWYVLKVQEDELSSYCFQTRAWPTQMTVSNRVADHNLNKVTRGVLNILLLSKCVDLCSQRFSVFVTKEEQAGGLVSQSRSTILGEDFSSFLLGENPQQTAPHLYRPNTYISCIYMLHLLFAYCLLCIFNCCCATGLEEGISGRSCTICLAQMLQ